MERVGENSPQRLEKFFKSFKNSKSKFDDSKIQRFEDQIRNFEDQI